MSDGAGNVYILSNPSMPGLLNVGASYELPGEVVGALSRAAGVPALFRVEFYAEVEDVPRARALLHAALDMYRTSDDRDFFQLPVARATCVVEAVLRELERVRSGDVDVRSMQEQREPQPERPPARPLPAPRPAEDRCGICGGGLLALPGPRGLVRRCANATCFQRFPRSYPLPAR